MMKCARHWMLVLALAAGMPGAAAAQGVTTADVQRLQDNIYEAAREVGQIGSRDASLKSQLQSELDEARDEATYLKVKLRKNEPIAQMEYTDLRGKIEYIRTAGGSVRIFVDTLWRDPNRTDRAVETAPWQEESTQA